MSQDLAEELYKGRSLLVKLGNGAGAGQPAFRGDLAVSPMDGLSGQRIQVDLAWFGMASRSLWTNHGETGKLSISGLSGVGECTALGKGRWSLDVDLKADVLYDAIERALGTEEVQPGLFESSTETFRGRLRANITEAPGDDPRNMAVQVLFSDLELTYVEGGLGWISKIQLPVSALPPTAALSRPPVPGCPVGRNAGRRILKLRPFAFRNDANDALHSGTSWPGQLQAAKAIWGACCLQVDAEPLRLIDNPTLKNSSSIQRIRNEIQSGESLETIEVILVNGVLPDGGGSTSHPGHLQAQVVMTNRNDGNPNLLAHELGHVLAGGHPAEPSNSKRWAGDPDTVLQPSNSPNLPNPSRNTLNNCRQARNPALITTGNACCIPAIVA
ncbi:MAG TPA: hypothetical protein VG477_00920 [Thermoanaerobaculia bacterium]|nr:hypothetical protein [Thermoanaerobaculia bacterium]